MCCGRDAKDVFEFCLQVSCNVIAANLIELVDCFTDELDELDELEELSLELDEELELTPFEELDELDNEELLLD